MIVINAAGYNSPIACRAIALADARVTPVNNPFIDLDVLAHFTRSRSTSRDRGASRPQSVSSHKKPAVRNAIRARGARLRFLPPWGPDLNPIEQVFAKLKHLPRKAAERSIEATWRRIASLLDAFPPHKCANYLRNRGDGAA